MSRNPRVTVCIPTRNRSKFLRESVQSVLDQSFPDLELVISDNASEDDTEAVVASFSDSRIRYHRHPENVGFVRNLNACLRLARGEYVAILYDDDAYLPSMIQRCAQVLKEHPGVGLVFSACIRIDQSGVQFGEYRPYPGDFVINGREQLMRDALNNSIWASTVVVRSECYERLGSYSDAFPYAPDWEMWMRIETAYDVAYVAEPLVRYRAHATNMLHEVIAEGLDSLDHYRVLESIFNRLPPTREFVDLKRKAMRKSLYGRFLLGGDNTMRGFRAQIHRSLRGDPGLVLDLRVPVFYVASLFGRRFLESVRRRKRQWIGVGAGHLSR